MKLHYWKSIPEVTNFGDQLSPWLWERELPDFFDGADDEIFLGIGTLLDNTVPKADKYIVMGAGAGYHDKVETDSRWKFYSVRGPLTASKYGLEKEIALTDPAVLLAKWFDKSKIKKSEKTYFIPHWSTAKCDWENVCKIAGFEYINPNASIEEILNKIVMAKMIISESLHGAIVADTLRVPWIAVQSNFKDFSMFKWNDWLMSMEMSSRINNIDKPWAKPKKSDFMLKKLTKNILGRVKLMKCAKRLVYLKNNVQSLLSEEKIIQEKVEKYEYRIKKMKNDLSCKKLTN